MDMTKWQTFTARSGHRFIAYNEGGAPPIVVAGWLKWGWLPVRVYVAVNLGWGWRRLSLGTRP